MMEAVKEAPVVDIPCPAAVQSAVVKGVKPEKATKDASHHFYDDLMGVLGPFKRFYFQQDRAEASQGGKKNGQCAANTGAGIVLTNSNSATGKLERNERGHQRHLPNGSRALRLPVPVLPGATTPSQQSQPQPQLQPQPITGPTLKEKYGRISCFLGKGSNGSCYLVRRQSDEQVFAVKEFRKKGSDESQKDYIKKLTNEYTIGTLMDHPNVVHILDLIIEKSHCYEVMELCEGGDLFEAISSTPSSLPVPQSHCIFLQLLQGVSYLHSIGICHRDLKPENCLFDKNGILKLIDFGSADVFKGPFDRDLRRSKGRCGSGPYIAPEEFTEGSYDGRKVDVWACAIIYLALMLRRFPWKMAHTKDPDYAAYVKSPTHQLRLIGMLPQETQALIRSMLDPDPAKRPTVDEIVAMNIFKPCNASGVHRHGRRKAM